MAYDGGVRWRLGRPEGDERYPYLGAAGACLGGGTPLLQRDGSGAWRVRRRAELEHLFAIGYGEPCDLGTRMGGLTALAGALNRGEEARAAIGLVHLRLPPLPDAASGERMAKADALLKAGYNPNEPRVPKGQSGGGQWTSGGGVGGGASSTSAERHLRPLVGRRLAMSPDCQAEWRQAKIMCNDLEDQGKLGIRFSGFGRTYEECVRGMVSARCGGNPIG